jgi:hypothetical protein
MTSEEYEAAIKRLQNDVDYWKSEYNHMKTENDKLALDLGLRDYPQWRDIPKGE